MLLGGAGIAAGLYVASKAVDFFNKSIEASNEEGGAKLTRLLTLSLSNIPMLAKRGTAAIHEQVAAIGEIAEKLQHVSGTSAMVYKAGYETLVQFGATKREISALSKPMADYLAMTKGVEASQEDSVELANKIGAAIDTRKLGRFARELGISPDQQRQWKALTSNFQRMEFLATAIEKKFKGAAASQGGTAAGRLSEIEAEQKAIEAQYGDRFKVMEAKWKTLVLKMETALLPLAQPMVDAMVKGFDTIEAAGTKLWAQLGKGGPGSDIWKKWADGIKAVMDAYDWDPAANLKDLQDTATNVLNIFTTIGTIVGKIGDTWNAMESETERIVRMLGGHISAEDTKAIIEDAKAREARGGHVGDKPGTFPELPKTTPMLPTLASQRAIETHTDAVKAVTASTKVYEGSLWTQNKATEAVTRSQDVVADSLKLLDDAAKTAALHLGQFGGNYGYGPLQDSPTHDQTYFEYDDEGHSSQYGPEGNRLGDDYGVGLSRWNQAHGHPIGSWVDIRTPSGKVVRRQVNETASRDIEFHTKRGQESQYGEGRSHIIEAPSPIRPVKPTTKVGHTIHSSPQIHIHGAADKSVVALIEEALEKHRANLLRDLEEVDSDDYRTSFA